MAIIKIFQTSDVHGNIYQTEVNNEVVFGFSKIASVIDAESKNADYSLKLDAGDVLQGSVLSFYLEQENITEPSVIDAFNLMDYDVLTFGNHEFNYGQKYLVDNYSRFNKDIISANVIGLDLDVKPYNVFEFDGFKIAVIGLTTDFVPMFEKEEHIAGLSFKSPYETYKFYEKELMENSDLIVVLYHGGFELDLDDCHTETEKQSGENIASKMVNDFPSIDIMLTGHQHRQIAQKINNAVCLQPGSNGMFVSTITIDSDLREVIDYQLINCNDYDINSNIVNYFEYLNYNCNQFLDAPIAKLNQDLLINDISDARLNSHPLTSFLCEIFMDYMPSDIVGINLFDTAVGFKKDVTLRQINRNYPFPNNLVQIEVSGAQLIEIMNLSNEYYTLDDNNEISINEKFIYPKLRHFDYDMFYGVSYDVIVKKDKNVIKNIKFKGADIDLDKKYTMLVNSYRSTNIGVYPVYGEVKILFESEIDMSTIILNYLKKHQKIDVFNNLDYHIYK